MVSKFVLLLFSLRNVCAQVIPRTVPSSPFGVASSICPSANGVPYSVGGFPGTPFVIRPFTEFYKMPDVAQSKDKVCREDGHCIYSYEMRIQQVQKRVFDNTIPSCKAFPGTWFLSYNGSIPGPTIITPTGHETVIRFRNMINYDTGFFKGSFNPCLPNNNRIGRPISVHLHGSASLAPYDGWAEDETCFNEIKDYVYPNNRPGTGWYHDHALHITADNAYFGLAGLYLVSSKPQQGGCGEPWGLDTMEERSMVLSDKVLDNKCQLFSDPLGVHEDDLYGDINLVSGIPFPKMPMEPKWYRFRFLNAAVARPYLLKLKDHRLNDIGSRLCKIIATDGGFRNTPVNFPVGGLLIGVAERYEVVCNFSNYAGRIVYWWNDFDPVMMYNVPYFCHSHLLARMEFAMQTTELSPAVYNNKVVSEPIQPLNKVLSTADINLAQQMAAADTYHRVFKFGRTNGHWTINGETWDSFKIAATDIGQNTWELWKFETGGGWFHPVHMHLVDFYIILRQGGDNLGVREYEKLSPKDVFYLGPSNNVYAIIRFGAHKGDYMFHCHNLIHEDNDMMRAYKIIHSHMGKTAHTAEPFVINKLYGIVYNNWNYDDPMLGETAAKPASQTRSLSRIAVSNILSKNLYRIFYPTPTDIQLMEGAANPWQSKWCPAI
jgi:FtsP/CotA-like multicopper oxidase with cupredoxin domain